MNEGGIVNPILVDAREARRMLGNVSKTTLWRLVRSGEFVSLKIGRKTVYRHADIVKFSQRLNSEQHTTSIGCSDKAVEIESTAFDRHGA